MVSTEKRIVASCLKSREANDKIQAVVSRSLLTPYSLYLLDITEDFYKRDKDAKHVDPDYLVEKLTASFDNPKKGELYVQFGKECLSLDVSAVNVAELLLETRTQESAAELAQALINSGGAGEDVSAKIDRHKELLSYVDREEEGPDTEVLHNVSVKEINTTVLNPSGLIKLCSKQITDALGGGALPGHTIVIFKRPETGGTAFVLSCMASLVKQGLDGIYFGNEDPIRSIVERFQGCLTRMPRLDRLRDPAAAQIVLEAQKYGLARFVDLAPGSLNQIDEYCDEFKPKWMVVDQLRNLVTKAENRTNQLETIQTGLRRIAKVRSLLGLDVTQAGDSGENKLVLTMGDVDGSNTGIPAQCDAMIGIGVNEEFAKQGLRMIALPKNKIGGKHIHFPMKINEELSRYEDI